MMKVSYALAVFCFSLSQIVFCTAQSVCNGVVTGTVAEVEVRGGTCTLRGAIVTGSVIVSNQGSLRIRGDTQVFGSIEATGSGNIDIGGISTVSGSVLFSNSASSTLKIGRNAVVTTLSGENFGTVLLQGATGTMENMASGVVNIDGGEIRGRGLLIEQGMGDVILCGAAITGSVSFRERERERESSMRAVGGPGCAPSTITGSVGIERGQGDVLITEILE